MPSNPEKQCEIINPQKIREESSYFDKRKKIFDRQKKDIQKMTVDQRESFSQQIKKYRAESISIKKSEQIAKKYLITIDNCSAEFLGKEVFQVTGYTAYSLGALLKYREDADRIEIIIPTEFAKGPQRAAKKIYKREKNGEYYDENGNRLVILGKEIVIISPEGKEEKEKNQREKIQKQRLADAQKAYRKGNLEEARVLLKNILKQEEFPTLKREAEKILKRIAKQKIRRIKSFLQKMPLNRQKKANEQRIVTQLQSGLEQGLTIRENQEMIANKESKMTEVAALEQSISLKYARYLEAGKEEKNYLLLELTNEAMKNWDENPYRARRTCLEFYFEILKKNTSVQNILKKLTHEEKDEDEDEDKKKGKEDKDTTSKKEKIPPKKTKKEPLDLIKEILGRKADIRFESLLDTEAFEGLKAIYGGKKARNKYAQTLMLGINFNALRSLLPRNKRKKSDLDLAEEFGKDLEKQTAKKFEAKEGAKKDLLIEEKELGNKEQKAGTQLEKEYYQSLKYLRKGQTGPGYHLLKFIATRPKENRELAEKAQEILKIFSINILEKAEEMAKSLLRESGQSGLTGIFGGRILEAKLELKYIDLLKTAIISEKAYSIETAKDYVEKNINKQGLNFIQKTLLKRYVFHADRSIIWRILGRETSKNGSSMWKYFTLELAERVGADGNWNNIAAFPLARDLYLEILTKNQNIIQKLISHIKKFLLNSTAQKQKYEQEYIAKKLQEKNKKSITDLTREEKQNLEQEAANYANLKILEQGKIIAITQLLLTPTDQLSSDQAEQEALSKLKKLYIVKGIQSVQQRLFKFLTDKFPVTKAIFKGLDLAAAITANRVDLVLKKLFSEDIFKKQKKVLGLFIFGASS